MDDLALAQLLTAVAADLDRKLYPAVGVLRQAARRLATATPDSDGCRGCGAHLDQPPTGRRRVWCSESCRRRKRP